MSVGGSGESLDFDPALVTELDRVVAPLKRLLSPVSLGIEHVPRRGPVLLAGNRPARRRRPRAGGEVG